MEETLNTKKFSYEELEKVASELANQVRMYETQIKNNQFNETVARLNYLFKVVEFDTKFDAEYVKGCTEEIMAILPMNKEAEETPTVVEMPTPKTKKR